MFKCLTEIYKKIPQKLAPALNSKCSLTDGLGIEIKFEFTNYLFFHI